jgi:DNA-binding XRE family transcriptional regulator
MSGLPYRERAPRFRNSSFMIGSGIEMAVSRTVGFKAASEVVSKFMSRPGFAALVDEARKKLNGDAKPSTLAGLRRATGMSQQALAAKVGTSQPVISMYESGEREPSLDMLLSLATALGVDFNTLVPAVRRG